MGELSVSITKGIRSACISPERKIINSNITITLHPLMVASWKKPGVSSPRLPWRVGRTFTCAFPDFWESSHAFESWFRWSTWAKQEREVSEYERTIKRGVGCTRSTYFTFVHLEVGQQEKRKQAAKYLLHLFDYIISWVEIKRLRLLAAVGSHSGRCERAVASAGARFQHERGLERGRGRGALDPKGHGTAR